MDSTAAFELPRERQAGRTTIANIKSFQIVVGGADAQVPR